MNIGASMVLDDALVTEREAAQFLGVTTGTMRNKRRAGVAPPHIRLDGDGGGVRYSARALVQFVAQNTRTPDQSGGPETLRSPILAVLDDFHPDFRLVRAHALASEFIDWKGYDGEVYKRVCLTDVPGLRERIEQEVGPVDMLGMGYRLNYAGERPNTLIHSDVGWGTHALVLYLTDGPSGTAFWRHRTTGAARLPEGDTTLLERVQRDWNDVAAWDMQRVVPMRSNRAVIYEGSYFHSRYPFTAFGDKPENGRLIAIAFFSPAKDGPAHDPQRNRR